MDKINFTSFRIHISIMRFRVFLLDYASTENSYDFFLPFDLLQIPTQCRKNIGWTCIIQFPNWSFKENASVPKWFLGPNSSESVLFQGTDAIVNNFLERYLISLRNIHTNFFKSFDTYEAYHYCTMRIHNFFKAYFIHVKRKKHLKLYSELHS